MSVALEAKGGAFNEEATSDDMRGYWDKGTVVWRYESVPVRDWRGGSARKRTCHQA